MIDRKDTTCTKCGKGKYVETSVMDDINGVLHCSKCNHQVFRLERK